MTAFLLAVQLATAAVPCHTVQPGPQWVCQAGGWLPPGHPDLAPPPAPQTPPDTPPQPKRAFWLGHRYTRGTTDVRIIGAGQLPEGVPVVFALCDTEGDGCFFAGMVRMFLANTESSDWTDHGPY